MSVLRSFKGTNINASCPASEQCSRRDAPERRAPEVGLAECLDQPSHKLKQLPTCPRLHAPDRSARQVIAGRIPVVPVNSDSYPSAHVRIVCAGARVPRLSPPPYVRAGIQTAPTDEGRAVIFSS